MKTIMPTIKPTASTSNPQGIDTALLPVGMGPPISQPLDAAIVPENRCAEQACGIVGLSCHKSWADEGVGPTSGVQSTRYRSPIAATSRSYTPERGRVLA